MTPSGDIPELQVTSARQPPAQYSIECCRIGHRLIERNLGELASIHDTAIETFLKDDAGQ